MSSMVKYFSVGDGTYAYKISGTGIPVVLLHGFTGSKTTWSTFVSQWKDNFQLITIDLPGHGVTKTETPRTMEECCHDLAKMFEYLKLTKIHLVGYSMGGRVALSFANLYPELISSLILESTSPGIWSNKEREERIANDEKLAQRIETGGVPEFVDFWEEIPLFASQKELSKSSKQSVRQERLSQSEQGLVMSLRFMGTGSQPSLWGKLTRFPQPVLLIVGELDQKFITINQDMRQYFQYVNLVIVENAGHAIHVEKPTKFGKLVKAFILSHAS